MDSTDSTNRIAELEAQVQALEDRIPDSAIISNSFFKRVMTVFGYNVVIYVVLMLPFTVLVLAVAIPQFARMENRDYVTAMKSDLRNLATTQEMYFADNTAYSSDLAALGFTTSTGVIGPTIVLTSDGWTASVEHNINSNLCAIFMGSTPISPATHEGEPRCTQP